MAAQAELGGYAHTCTAGVGISDQQFGWMDCACGYVDPQLLDLKPHCMLPSRWHKHFFTCLSQLKTVPARRDNAYARLCHGKSGLGVAQGH